MCNMPAEGIKIEKHFRKNLGQYFTDGFGSDGSVVKGLNLYHQQSVQGRTEPRILGLLKVTIWHSVHIKMF